MKNVTVFLLGGFGYGLCEILWRGYTHFSMFLLGGVCLVAVYIAEKKFYVLSFALRCFFAALFFTSMELVCGCVVNILLQLDVWDYSSMPLNFYGQICLSFSLLWLILAPVVLLLCAVLRKSFDKCYPFKC